MRRSSRWSASVLLACALWSTGCYRWLPLDRQALAAGSPDLRLARVRFASVAGPVEMQVHRVNPAYVDGWSESLGREIRVQTAAMPELEVRRQNVALTTLTTVGIALAVPVGALIAFFVALRGNN